MPGETFELRLSALPRRAGHSSEKALQEAVRAFWLLVHLGGLGTRSRRFAGSIRARYEQRPEGLPLPSFTPDTPHEKWLQEELEALELKSDRDTTRDFDHLGRACIWLGDSYASCKKIVDDVGEAYKDFRDPKTDGQKVGFGLPIGQGDDRVQVKRKDSDEEITRRASPFWMQIVETPSKKYRPVFTLFESNFLPDSGNLRINGRSFNDAFEQTAPFFASSQADQIFSA